MAASPARRAPVGRPPQIQPLFIVVAAFVTLGLVYSVVTPIFETPDELQHYAHANYIARYHWFPPLGVLGQHLWDQQSLQAPLFYWTAAALTFGIDTSDLGDQAVLQPKANIGDATLPGKKNAFVHGPAQAFPYHNTALAVHLCRWLSVLFGAGTVALTGLIARLSLGPAQQAYAPLAAAVLAFIPQFIFINASCSNDPAIVFTSTLTLFSLLWIYRHGITPQRAALFGVAAGLMALSKLIGTVLAGVALVLLLLVTRRWWALALAALTFALVAGWWYARNELLYGDPLALGAFLKFVGGNLDIPPMTLASLWDQFRLLRFSTWGLFGHISVLMQPVWIYSVFDIGALLGLGALAVLLARQLVEAVRSKAWLLGLRAWAQEQGAVLILVVWLGTVLALGARWFAAAGLQGRLIFPGMAAGAVLWTLGLTYLAGRRSSRFVSLAVAAPLAAFAAAVVPAYLIPAYSPPPLVNAMPQQATPTTVQFGEEIALRGYTIARDAGILRLTFYWQALKTPQTDYFVAVRLVRPDGTFWLDYVNFPGMGTSLPATWQPGELRQDEYVFDLARFPAEPLPLRLIVGFFDRRRSEMIPVTHWPDIREPNWATLTEIQITDN